MNWNLPVYGTGHSVPRRAFLGVELPGDAEAFGDGGMRIAGVLPGGMAAAAAFTAGDVLVGIGGLPVRDREELADALRRAGGLAEVELAATRVTRRVAVIPAPHDADVTLGELAVEGARLRVLVTDGPRATVVLLGGIACESLEDGPLAELARALTRAGYATLRVDKRGVGDSEGGPAREVDFATELSDARAAVELARQRRLPVVVFGHSIGGVIAPHTRADAIAVYGTPVRPWIDCLLDSVRRQMTMRGAPADDIAHRLAEITRLATTGELNGRSAAYHRQLAALDLEAPWRATPPGVPVLVLRGEHDWVVAGDDQARLAELARGELVDLPGLDHVLGAHADREASLRDYGAGLPDDTAAKALLGWLDRIMITG